MILSIEEITEKVRPIAKKYNLKEMYLFGSYARGEAEEESDIDFVIDSSRIKDYDELFDLQQDLEKALKSSVDIVEKEVLSNNNNCSENSLINLFKKTCWWLLNLYKKDLRYVKNMIHFGEKALETYSKVNNDVDALEDNYDLYNSVLMSLVQLGENANLLSTNFKEKYSDTNWRKHIKNRNFMSMYTVQNI